MAHSNQWDETRPTSKCLGVDMDDETKKLRIDIRERGAVDHKFNSSDTKEAWIGTHSKVTLKERISTPTVAGTQKCLYRKTGDYANECRVRDSVPVDHCVVKVGVIGMFLGDAPDGWLELHGDTIGSASSGATHAATTFHDLYVHLWNNVSQSHAPVTGGRGASAEADWNANKKLGLMDGRSRILVNAGQGSGLLHTWTLGSDDDGAETIVADHSHNQIGHTHEITDDVHTHVHGGAGMEQSGSDSLASFSHDHGGALDSQASLSAYSGSQPVMNPFLAFRYAIKY